MFARIGKIICQYGKYVYFCKLKIKPRKVKFYNKSFTKPLFKTAKNSRQ